MFANANGSFVMRATESKLYGEFYDSPRTNESLRSLHSGAALFTAAVNFTRKLPADNITESTVRFGARWVRYYVLSAIMQRRFATLRPHARHSDIMTTKHRSRITPCQPIPLFLLFTHHSLPVSTSVGRTFFTLGRHVGDALCTICSFVGFNKSPLARKHCQLRLSRRTDGRTD